MRGLIYPSILYVLADLWLFAAIHHGVMSRVRPHERLQRWFALMALLMAAFMVLRAVGQQPLAAEVLALLQGLEFATSALAFATLPDATFLQPFLAYTTLAAWTLAVNTGSTYDRENEQGAVPINGALSKVIGVSAQTISIAAGIRYWADAPDISPGDWGLRLQATVLFPRDRSASTGRRPEPVHPCPTSAGCPSPSTS